MTAFISPTVGIAGEPNLELVVEARDQNGDLWTGYRGGIELVESSSSTLPNRKPSCCGNYPDYTFTAADAGRHTFTFAFNSGGIHNVYIYDHANSNRNTTSNDVDVAEIFLTAFISPTVGIAYDKAFTLTVEARDENGNIWTNYRGQIEFSGSVPTTYLPDLKPACCGDYPDYTFTAADAGQATFNFAFNQTGTQGIYVYDFANSNRNVTSNDVNVTEPPPPPVPSPTDSGSIPPVYGGSGGAGSPGGSGAPGGPGGPGGSGGSASISYGFGLPLMAVDVLPSNSWMGYPQHKILSSEGAIYLTAGFAHRTQYSPWWSTFYTVNYLGWENPLTDQRDAGGGVDGGPARGDDYAFHVDSAGFTWPISHGPSNQGLTFSGIAPANTEGVHLDVHTGGNSAGEFIIGTNVAFDDELECDTPAETRKAGDPIDTRSGMFYLTEQDFGIGTGCDGIDLRFERTYRSMGLTDSAFGYGWAHNYDQAVVTLNDDYVAVRRPRGSYLVFKDTGTDVYATKPGAQHMLVKRPEGGWALVRLDRHVDLFDANGRLISQQDANGNMVWLTYETATRYDQTVTRLARVDASGGRFLWFGYDYYDIDVLTQVADHSGRTVYYDYDSFGFLNAVTDSLSATTTYTYENFLLTSQSDPLGNVVFDNQYDDGGRVITQTNSMGQFLVLGYEITTEAITTTVSEQNTGAETTYVYNSDGLLTQVIDPLGGTTTYRNYTDTRQPQEIENALGNTTQIAYTMGGWPVVITDTLGNSTHIAYDNWANPLFITDTLGRSTQFLYGDGINLTQMIDPAGSSVQFIYEDQAGWHNKLTGVVNQAGITTTLTYDAAGDTTEITNILGGIAHIAYDDLGRPTGIADSRGYTTTLAFNDADQLTQIVDPLGGTVDLTYLPTGQISMTQIAGLHPTVYTYRSNGLPETAQQGGRVWHFNYDTQGNLVNVTDPLSQTVHFDYDLASRTTSQTLPDNRTIDFGYDSAGNMTSLTPPGRDAHTFTPTPLNMLGSYAPPLVGSEQPISYTYNAAGQITQIRRPDTSTIDMTYDVSGRLQTTTIPQGVYQLGYDADTSTLNTIAAPSGITLTYAYTGMLPIGQAWQGTVNGSVNVSYDPDLRLASEIVNGQSITFTYDAAGRLEQVGNITLTHNTQNGLLMSSNLGSIADAWQYNGFGEPSSYQAAYNGSDILTATYIRDDVGRILTKTETINGGTLIAGYTYDKTGRLITVTENNIVTAQYSYDLNGNRLAYTDTMGTVITATYDGQDRLTRYGTAIYEYTPAGELKTKIDTGSNLTTTYDYDAFGNLITAVLPDGTQLDYLIDGQNRRVGKMVDGVLTQGFLYRDQLNPVAELDSNGQVIAQFIYASKTHVPDYMVKSGIAYRILTDHLGSPRMVINADTGQIMQEMAYDAFGNVITDTSPGFQPFGFAGGLYDQHTKLTRFGVRDYDAIVGRWTAKDPLNFGGGDSNLYAYVMNDPINLIDPTGEFWWIVVGVGIGGGIDLLLQYHKYDGDWSQINKTQVVLAAAAGGLGGGLGYITTNVFATTIGSGFIGSGLTYLGNVLNGECDLMKNVWEVGVLSGVFGGLGSYVGNTISRGGNAIAYRTNYAKFWNESIFTRMANGSPAKSSTLATGFANSTSITISNSGNTILPWLDKINYFRPLEFGCNCR